jgi:hypothetical protein
VPFSAVLGFEQRGQHGGSQLLSSALRAQGNLQAG